MGSFRFGSVHYVGSGSARLCGGVFGRSFRVGLLVAQRAVAVHKSAVRIGIFFIEIHQSDIVEVGISRGHITGGIVARTQRQNNGYAAARGVVGIDVSDEFLPFSARIDSFERGVSHAVDIDVCAGFAFVKVLRIVASVQPIFVVGPVGKYIRLDPHAQLINAVCGQCY